jgi:hypothetical protein
MAWLPRYSGRLLNGTYAVSGAVICMSDCLDWVALLREAVRFSTRLALPSLKIHQCRSAGRIAESKTSKVADPSDRGSDAAKFIFIVESCRIA